MTRSSGRSWCTEVVVAAAWLLAATTAVASNGVLSNPAVNGIARIAPGGWHACAVTASGGVQCWGRNDYGQLGNGTFTSSAVAVDVAGLMSGVLAVTTGDNHSCALLTAGTVKCWGQNDQRQLGFEPQFPFPGFTNAYPTDVPGLTGVFALSAGMVHTCALTSAGAVKCWGNNYYGQLGNGNNVTGAAIVDVVGLGANVASIEAGDLHTCALTAAGGAKCWGLNNLGQLGTGSTLNTNAPANVSGLASGVVAIAAGSAHSCAIVASGDVKCWGANGVGQLGNGTTVDALAPVDMNVGAAASSLALGRRHSCVLLVNGSVRCSGGSPENGATAATLVPAPVGALSSGVQSIASHGYFTCGVVAGGVALCWGFNSYGELGDGISPRVPNPVDVLIDDDVIAIATGEDHACALLPGGNVKCWGRNSFGQLGNGGTAHAFVPVDVALGTAASSIRAGGYLSCAITITGAARCWGAVVATPQVLPADVPGLESGIADVAIGFIHACALTQAGAVKCWGANSFGQLGNGTTADPVGLVDVIGLGANVIAIGAGKFHSCAILNDGSVRCWGANDWGQVNGARGGIATTPTVVGGLTEPATIVDGGDAHTCVRTVTQAMQCWGSNSSAQLGIGHRADLPGVVTVPLGVPTSSFATGPYHNCQLDNAGALRCWGQNGNGEVADGTLQSPVLSPHQVPGVAAATAVSASGSFTCALVNGAVRCWGSNFFGQLGNGVGGFKVVPTPVVAGLCGGFDDVVAGNPFCANVDWVRNRAVTQGCTPDTYCPAGLVSRLAMAAFMNRVGTAMTPLLANREQSVGPINARNLIACATDEIAISTQPRRAHFDAILRATAPSDVDVVVRVAWSPDDGLTWLSWDEHRIAARAGRWLNFRAVGDYDFVGKSNVRFGILLYSPLPSPAKLDFSDSSCNLRVRLDNLNLEAAPP